MAWKLIALFALFCTAQICLGTVPDWILNYTRLALIEDPKLEEQGYSCQNNKLLMKNGEENDNYSPELCGKVSCKEGVFFYEICSPSSVEDPTKPYPECC